MSASDVAWGRQAGRIVRAKGKDIPVSPCGVCGGPVIVGAPLRVHGVCCAHEDARPAPGEPAYCRRCGMTVGA